MLSYIPIDREILKRRRKIVVVTLVGDCGCDLESAWSGGWRWLLLSWPCRKHVKLAADASAKEYVFSGRPGLPSFRMI